MFCDFYLVKSHKIANNPTTTKDRVKIGTICRIFEIFDLGLETFKFYLIKLATDF